MVRELGVLAALLVACGCSGASVFQCTDETECSVGGQAGFCDAPGYCSFSDAACPSGRRFGSLAGMGLADECVQGAAGSTGVADSSTSVGPSSGSGGSSSSSSMPPQTSSSSSTTDVASESSTGLASSSDSSSDSSFGSSSGGSDPVCTVYEFDGAQPFEPINPPFSLDVGTTGGTLRASWMPLQLATASFRVAAPVDVSLGSLEVEFAEFPQEEGTVLTARWEDGTGRLVSAFVDGDEFLVTHDAVDKDGVEQTTPLLTEPHAGRTRLRIRSDGELIVFEAGDEGGFETLVTLDPAGDGATPFDRTGVDVRVVFLRYVSGGAPTSIALESVTSCASP